jgi:hypothetical protein
MRGSSVRDGQAGEGRFKAIVWLAIFAAMIYVGVMVVPILYSEYQFQDAMTSAARFGSANRLSADDIRKNLATEAKSDSIPIEPEDIHVEASGGNVRIGASYSVTVNLQVYQWTLNFNPTASTDRL